MSEQAPIAPGTAETPISPPPDQAPSPTPDHPTPTGDDPDGESSSQSS